MNCNLRSILASKAGQLLLFGFLVLGGARLTGAGFDEFSLEELSKVPVVQSAKQDDRLFDAPSGAFVFDENDISYLPVDSIPELLRYAPGMHIKRASNGIWGMGARGMNSRFFSRVLFTVDEQSVYGTVIGGFFGAQHDLLMEDIASVEVVHGPGGGMWGQNSANGRVNVLMKSTFETEGTILKTHIGDESRSVSARHGWSINEKTSARVYFKSQERDPAFSELFEDDWETMRGGLQVDMRPSSQDLISLSAEVFESVLGYARPSFDSATGISSLYTENERHEGFAGQAKWTRQIDEDNGFSLRAWASDTQYDIYDFWIIGMEGRLRSRVSDTQSFVLTAGVTYDEEIIRNSDLITFKDSSPRNNPTAHAGGEYKVTPWGENIELAVGLSANYEDYSKEVNWLPTARALFRVSETDRIWLSYSQSSRAAPSVLNDSEEISYGAMPIQPIPIPTPFGTVSISQQAVIGSYMDNVQNEELDALQLGYRKQVGESGTLSLNTFYYDYRNLTGTVSKGMPSVQLPGIPGSSIVVPYLKIESEITNVADGWSTGFDASFKYEFSKWFMASVTYAYIKDDFSSTLPEGDPILASSLSIINNNVPEHIGSLWLSSNISENFRADVTLRYTSAFSSLIAFQDSVFQSDVGLSWQPREKLRISLVGRNLLGARTSEAVLKDSIGFSTEQKREAYLEFRYEF